MFLQSIHVLRLLGDQIRFLFFSCWGRLFLGLLFFHIFYIGNDDVILLGCHICVLYRIWLVFVLFCFDEGLPGCCILLFWIGMGFLFSKPGIFHLRWDGIYYYLEILVLLIFVVWFLVGFVLVFLRMFPIFFVLQHIFM